MSDIDPDDLQTEETTSEEGITEEAGEDTEPSKIAAKVEGQDVEMSPDEFARFYKDWTNEQKWQAKYHQKGKELNTKEQTLSEREKKLSGQENLLGEYQKIKGAMQANPKAYAYLQKLMNESEPAVAPAIKKQLDEEKTERENFRREYERDKAVLSLSKEFSDFDVDSVEDFVTGFNFNKQEDLLKLAFFAKQGAELDDKLAEARADVVRKARQKKGAPATGKKETVSTSKGKTIAEMARAAKEALSRGESLT